MILRLLACATLLIPVGTAAAPQEAATPQAAFDTRLRHAQEAFEKGDFVAAGQHASSALLFDPWNLTALELALASCDADADAHALWAYRIWGAMANAEGKVPERSKLAETVKSSLPGVEALAQARVEACRELARLVKAERKRMVRAPEQGLVGAWAAQLGSRLSADSPQLASSQGADLDLPYSFDARAQQSVVDDLDRLRGALHGRMEYGLAVRAALILRGLGAQGTDGDLQGEIPAGIDKLKRKAEGALTDSRRKLQAKFAEPLTVEQLQDMDMDSARAFSLAHEDPSNPGVAISLTERYRIETTCGHETLLGVADSVERHHGRLATWYGSDPFLQQPGLIRVLPESSGLETEGAPFWWAGGFQSGSVTTARFTCSTIEAFGHLLTHELTHRFDGALYPGLPSWLLEGKAVWTGGSFGSSHDANFVDNHVSFGTVEGAWIDGFGGQLKLRELIEGELEDYRDNYTAGYALYVYLKLYQEPEGNYVFAERLLKFMEGAKNNNKKPLAWFVKNFADGEAGRPADFAKFSEGFTTFMSGFYWDDRAPWTKRYQPSIERSNGQLVYDTPTWSWARRRAEPFWGQDHAQAAGDLFWEQGKGEEAADAYMWAWSVDEHSPELAGKLAAALEALGKREAAWVVSQQQNAGQPSPIKLPKVTAYAKLLRQQAAELSTARRQWAAAAFNADASWLETELGNAPPPIEAAMVPLGLGHPWNRPGQLLGLEGWEETSLTDYDKRRAAGCWYVEADGDVHVGRFRPRDTTGNLDRRAHNRHAFTRTSATQAAGRYAISCKVQFTTSFVSAALILGDTRRDRNIRLKFSAGDFLYSIGKNEEAETLDALNWHVDGLRERDPQLVGAQSRGKVKFDSARSNFELLAIVDGAVAHFWIEGQYLGAYHDALGIPIEGHVGFATSQGAIRIIEPEIQRLDRSRTARQALPADTAEESSEDLPVSAVFDLSSPPTTPFRAQQDLPLRGITPGPKGTLLVWIPLEEWSEELAEFTLGDLEQQVLETAKELRAMLKRASAETPIAFAIPDCLPPEFRGRLQTTLQAALEGIPGSVVNYAWSAPSSDLDFEPSGAQRTWLFFVDSAGVLRAIERWFSLSQRMPDELLHWVTVFRDEH